MSLPPLMHLTAEFMLKASSGACVTPGCTVDHILQVVPPCHLAPVQIGFRLSSKTFIVRCAVCATPFASIPVASASELVARPTMPPAEGVN